RFGKHAGSAKIDDLLVYFGEAPGAGCRLRVDRDGAGGRNAEPAFYIMIGIVKIDEGLLPHTGQNSLCLSRESVEPRFHLPCICLVGFGIAGVLLGETGSDPAHHQPCVFRIEPDMPVLARERPIIPMPAALVVFMRVPFMLMLVIMGIGLMTIMMACLVLMCVGLEGAALAQIKQPEPGRLGKRDD